MPRVMEGRQLAYYEPCATRIPVGTRIIAKYKDDDPKNTTISGSFYVGIVAEIPTAANKYRWVRERERGREAGNNKTYL